MPTLKDLLAVFPYGNFTEFDSVCKNLGFNLTTAKSLRKALGVIKNNPPDIIVAEFVFSPTYGSQLSNFESLFAAAQSYAPHACFIALTHPDDMQHIDKIKSKYGCCNVVRLPITSIQLENSIRLISGD